MSRLSFRRFIMTRARAAPPQVPTDQVVPMLYFDDTNMTRGMIMCHTMKFHDVLDADKLHDSLSRLLNLGGWRKLGGRLRLNVKTAKTPALKPRYVCIFTGRRSTDNQALR